MVTPQSARAIKLNSKAVGPVSVPPAGAARSQTIEWDLWLSTIERLFSNNVDFALIVDIKFTMHHFCFSRFKIYLQNLQKEQPLSR